MANPYHDAEGRFCSRDEMQAAIDQAAMNGDYTTYARLRKEMDEIDSSTKVLVEKQDFEQLVRKVAESTYKDLIFAASRRHSQDMFDDITYIQGVKLREQLLLGFRTLGFNKEQSQELYLALPNFDRNYLLEETAPLNKHVDDVEFLAEAHEFDYIGPALVHKEWLTYDDALKLLKVDHIQHWGSAHFILCSKFPEQLAQDETVAAKIANYYEGGNSHEPVVASFIEAYRSKNK